MNTNDSNTLPALGAMTSPRIDKKDRELWLYVDNMQDYSSTWQEALASGEGMTHYKSRAEVEHAQERGEIGFGFILRVTVEEELTEEIKPDLLVFSPEHPQGRPAAPGDLEWE